MVFTAFCGRALWHALYRALCVHCTCTVQNTVCAILLLEAWRHILCLWVAVKMNVSLDWGCGTCKREFVQACVWTAIAIKKKNIVLLCLLGSSFEDESVFGLRLWQVQKVVCSSLCLHIRKPKNLSRTESGFFKKNSHPVKLIAKKLACPLPPIQCCYIALLRKAFKKNSHFGSDAGMHWATTLIKGARGDQVWCDNM